MRIRLALPEHLSGPHPWLPAPDDDLSGTGGGGGAPAGAAGDQSQSADTGDATDWKAEAEKYRALSRKHEDRAKANAGAATELEKLKAATQTDTERAISEAKAAGQSEARSQMQRDLIAARFEAEALRAGRDDKAVTDLLEDLDLSRFVAADGSIDVDRIRKRAEALPVAAGQQQAEATQQRGATGQGAPPAPAAAAGAAGLAEAQRRFPQRTTAGVAGA